MSELLIGTRVTFSEGDVLFRNRISDEEAAALNRRWQRLRERDPEGIMTRWTRNEKGFIDREAFIVGKRTLSNGLYTRPYASYWDDGDVGEYRSKETFAVYLLSETLYTAHIKVRVEDVKVIS